MSTRLTGVPRCANQQPRIAFRGAFLGGKPWGSTYAKHLKGQPGPALVIASLCVPVLLQPCKPSFVFVVVARRIIVAIQRAIIPEGNTNDFGYF